MHHPQIAAFLVSLMLAACGLAGCASAPIDRSVELLGEPTPIKAGQSPMDVLCEIRAEFMALPKPVLRRIVYHGKSSRKRRVEFGTLSTKFLAAYYEFRLTDTAQQWAKGHTVAEISAALASLVLDPEVGGEAAVLLAGLATTRTSYREEYHPANVCHTG